MIPFVNAFVPLFGLLALGALLRRSLLPDEAVWKGLERLIFWVLLPALLVAAIGSAQLGELSIPRMMAAIWITLALGTIAAVLLARALRQPHAAMTSVLMGSIRFNNLIGVALVGALFELPGLALAGVATLLIVGFVEVVTSVAFALGRGGQLRLSAVLRQVALNPLVLACVVGFVVAGLGGLPPGVRPLVETLGRACIALGLLAVGAALLQGGLADRPALQFWTAALKLVALPAATLLLCRAMDLDPLSTSIAVLLMAMPTAATSYVVARAMGGDARLMAAITTSEHLLSVISLPLWVLLLQDFAEPE
ncbi:AEC family transporter [Falsiroseomonas oryzae]|uniref:AEC family transporter n=1 Tax=Falsiroseomonas oryzae TaxID=2766473 RepID=UPI0022EB68CF|nr:AEC family transporter [Roseomonas sp. MO-31]